MSDETQKIQDEETQLETQQLDDHDSVKQNGHTDENSTKTINMSNLCLKLISNPANLNLFPLNIGTTTIGRSKSSDICLIHKSVSRNHCGIQIDLNEDALEVHQCFLVDYGSLNKTKLNHSTLVKEDKNAINITDQIEIGALKFKFEKMTDEQVKEQQLSRTNTIDLYESASGNKSKPGLFEIQNTMEETVLIEDEKKHDLNEETEPEDNVCEDNLNNTSCPDFRLHMSSSFINQSTVTNKSLQIAETMNPEVEEEIEEEEDKEKIVESKPEIVSEQKNDDQNHSDEVKTTNKILLDEKNSDKDKCEVRIEKLVETKSDFEVKKYKSINDESIIINDDDEDEINLDKTNIQKNLIVAEEKPCEQVLVESEKMDQSSINAEPSSQLNETPVRRGRGRPRSSAGAKQEKIALKDMESRIEQQENTGTTAETVEEKPSAKVGRRSSLRVKNTPNPVPRPKRAVKLVEESESEEKKDEEETQRRKSVGTAAKKTADKNRRKTIDASSGASNEPKRKVGRPRLIREEEKCSPKRKSHEDENTQPKKNRSSKNNEESSDDEDNETLENVKKMLRKRSADKTQNETTPNIFFNSKRRNTPNSSLNQTPKKNDSADTPSKKFKLHKAISSSEENLDQSSGEEVVDKSEELEAKTDGQETKQQDVAEAQQTEQEENGEQVKVKSVKKVGRPALSRLPVASARHSARTNRNQN